MKRLLVLTLTVGFLGSTAMGQQVKLDVSVESDGMNSILVAPGATVNYELIGILDESLQPSEGLALFGLDLKFDGDDLLSADDPTSLPMTNFKKDDGITNPAGYGGTIITGDLIQVGGGQNTIRNTVDNAPYPIGDVSLDVAKSSIVLVTGSLTAPMADGTYLLSVENLFLNVITSGDRVGIPFFPTEAGEAGVVTNLSITVGCAAAIATSTPPNCAIDARQTSDLDGSNPAGWDAIEINLGCSTASVTPADFTVSHDGLGAAPTISNTVSNGNFITLELSSAIPAGAWTCFTHDASGTQTCLGYLPADANSDLTSAAPDIISLVNHLNGILPALELYQCDADRSDQCNGADIVRLIDLLNGAGPVFDEWLNVSLNPCPSE